MPETHRSESHCGEATPMDSTPSSIAADQLKAFIERIERLEEEKKALSDDIKDVYGEAKGTGFDTKIIRKIVALRKKDHAERKEEEAIMELYLEALGMA
jgi:uncharacterized protein (UPF0335 family)